MLRGLCLLFFVDYNVIFPPFPPCHQVSSSTPRSRRHSSLTACFCTILAIMTPPPRYSNTSYNRSTSHRRIACMTELLAFDITLHRRARSGLSSKGGCTECSIVASERCDLCTDVSSLLCSFSCLSLFILISLLTPANHVFSHERHQRDRQQGQLRFCCF